MTTLIHQHFPTDCMIASIAMALDLPWQEVYEAAIECGVYKADHSTGIRDEDTLLEHLGLVREASYKGVVGDFTQWHCEWNITPKFYISKLWGRPAILSVPSLNNPGGWHAVYYDGYELFDPNPPSRNRYDTVTDLQVKDVVVFRPNITEVLKRRRAERSEA